MDGMALLCTLHARGPTTLQRLRNAGVRRLEELTLLREEELARIVDVTPAAARRLAREADLLARRLGDAGSPRTERASTSPHGAGTRPELPAPWTPKPPLGIPRGPGVPGANEPHVELRPIQRPAAGPLPMHARPERTASYGQGMGMPSTTAEPSTPNADALLRPGMPPGLTAEVCHALEQAGVRSADELVRAANLSLARRIGLSYPKLLELAHGARSCVPGGTRSATDPAPGASIPQRVSVGCPSPEEVGAGGPFT